MEEKRYPSAKLKQKLNYTGSKHGRSFSQDKVPDNKNENKSLIQRKYEDLLRQYDLQLENKKNEENAVAAVNSKNLLENEKTYSNYITPNFSLVNIKQSEKSKNSQISQISQNNKNLKDDVAGNDNPNPNVTNIN
jgi:hypothetical protein